MPEWSARVAVIVAWPSAWSRAGELLDTFERPPANQRADPAGATVGTSDPPGQGGAMEVIEVAVRDEDEVDCLLVIGVGGRSRCPGRMKGHAVGEDRV